jgi:DNA-binding NtrC family response regulator
MPRILLVEDNAEVSNVFETVLRDEGYEVDATRTIHGGEQLLGSRDYDLLIVDGLLPDGTGIELANKGKERAIPALVTTGYGFSLGVEARELWNYTVLQKPVRPRDLTDAVVKALQNHDSFSRPGREP